MLPVPTHFLAAMPATVSQCLAMWGGGDSSSDEDDPAEGAPTAEGTSTVVDHDATQLMADEEDNTAPGAVDDDATQLVADDEPMEEETSAAAAKVDDDATQLMVDDDTEEDEQQQDDSAPAAKMDGGPAEEQEEENTNPKPILVALPGASGKFGVDFRELLLPALQSIFEVREWKGGWKGWNPTSNAKKVVENLCPTEGNAAPWYLLGASFGCRAAAAVAIDGLTAVRPVLIFTGYPVYGPKGTDERLQQFWSLPPGCRALCISGEKDEYLTKNVPADKPKGEALWTEIVANAACSASTAVRMVPKGDIWG